MMGAYTCGLSDGSEQQLADLCDHWGFMSRDQLRSCLDKAHFRLCYCAEENGGCWVGGLLATTSSESSDICFIFVQQSLRRSGIGRLLYQFFLSKIIDSSGYHEVFLEVRPSNRSAISFYRSLGMEKIGVRKSYYSDGEDALLFRREYQASEV